MKKYFATLTIFVLTMSAQAESLELYCATKDLNKTPYLTFNITLNSAEGKPVLAQPKSASISAFALSSYGAESPFYTPEPVTGCQPIETIVTTKQNAIEINCGNEDGEGGRVKLWLISNSGLAYGSIGFPNGLKLQRDFIDEESASWSLVCRFK